VLDAEAPTRIIKQLGQLWRACGMLGLDEARSWEAVRRAGLDSIPKLRRAVISYLGKSAVYERTSDIAEAVGHPSRTTLRALEDLTAHRVTVRTSYNRGQAYSWALSPDARGWWTTVGGD
jgi:hypothetical protein